MKKSCISRGLCVLFLMVCLAAAGVSGGETGTCTYGVVARLTTSDEARVFREIVFDPTGRTCALLTGDNPDYGGPLKTQELIIADGKTLKKRFTIPLGEEKAASIALSPRDMRCAVSAGRDILLYDTGKGILVRRISNLPGPGPIKFSPEGPELLLVNPDGMSMAIVNVREGKIKHRLQKCPGRIRTFDFANSGKTAITVSDQGNDESGGYIPSHLTSFNLTTGKVSRDLAVSDSLLGCAHVPGRSFFVTCGTGGLAVRDSTTLKEIRRVEGGTFSALAISGDGNYAAVIPIMEPYARVYDLQTLKQAGRTGRYGGHGTSVAFRGKTIFAAAFGETAYLFDLALKLPLSEEE